MECFWRTEDGLEKCWNLDWKSTAESIRFFTASVVGKPNKARFHNYILTIPEPKPRDSTTKPRDSATKTGALPQLHSHDSTTKIPRFHNQSPTIPQPKSHDSTTKLPRFHNQNLRIPQPKSQDSTTKISGFHNQTLRIPCFFGKTTATYFHYRRFLTSYKTFKNPPPPQNNRSNLSVQQAVWFKSLLVLE